MANELIKMNDTSTGVILTTVDYENVVANITEEQRQYYHSLTRDIDNNNPHSVQAYGSDLNNTIARQADQILSKSSSDSANSIVTLTNQLLKEINNVDIDANEQKTTKNKLFKTLKSIPLIKHIIRYEEDREIRKNSIKKNVDEVSNKIVSLKMIAMSDNQTIEGMMHNTIEFVKEIRQRIVALMIVQKDLQAEVDSMEASDVCNLDELQAKRNTLAAISKKLTNLTMTEYVLKQNFQQLSGMVACNDMIIDQSDETVSHVIPIWKSQVALATLMEKQKMAAYVEQRVSETANTMLAQNMKSFQENVVSITKTANSTTFKLETLRDTSRTLIDTVRQMQNIQKEGQQKWEEIRREMKSLGDEFSNTLRNS